MNRIFFIALFTAIAFCFAADEGLIKTVSSQWDSQEVQTLLQILHAAEKDGLNVHCLENKVREGIAKNKPAKRIIAAVEKRETTLRAIVKKEKNLPAAAQSKLLFETEKASTQPRPTLDRPQERVLSSEKKTVAQLKEPRGQQEVSQGGRIKNRSDAVSSRQRRLSDGQKSFSEEKFDKLLEKQESKLDKIERKLEINSARFKNKK
jgi:hypothetical protein